MDVITNPQTTAATPDMAIPFGLKARYSAQFQTGDRPFRQRRQRRRIPGNQSLQQL
ncbi:hypothetical protein CSC12_0402 [Klebsiella michiganensis]|nr:hypothetical protein CSC12_0402 [Klebsiella michiganensis]